MFAFQFKKVCSKKGMLGLISQICKAMEGSSDLLPDVIWAAGRWGRLLSRCRILAYKNSFVRNHESGKNFAFGESTFVNLSIGEILIFLFLPRKRLSSRNYRHQAEEILNSEWAARLTYTYKWPPKPLCPTTRTRLQRVSWNLEEE